MNKTPLFKEMLITLLGIGLVSVVVFGQGPGGQQPGAGRQIAQYNPATEETLKGTVQVVNEQLDPKGWKGTHLTLRTDKGDVSVHLGPSSFLAKNHFRVVPGDQLEVLGSRIKSAGGEFIVARDVKKGDKSLNLRNAAGVPAWSRGNRF